MNGVKATETQFIGNIGEKRISSILESWHIATNKLSDNDFGEDYHCDIFSCINNNTYIRTNQSFKVQVKTTPSFSKSYIRKTKKGYSFSVKTSLLDFWKSCFFPTILCVWCIEENKGFWCAPVEEIKNKEFSNRDKITIHLFEDFEASEEKIKSYVSNFYNSMFKINEAQFSCSIYPVWMPHYRLFTHKELLDIEKLNKKNISYIAPDELPSFLTSYNMLGSNYVSCVQVSERKSGIKEFLDFLFNQLIGVFSNVSNNGTWVSFIVSPIELVSGGHVIKTFTRWQSLSLVDNNIVGDQEYAFNPTSAYLPTLPKRSTSSNMNLWINKSNSYAIMLYSEAFQLLSRKESNKFINKLISNSYCVWDISTCTEVQREKLIEWCESNSLRLIETDLNNIVVISNELLLFGDYGAFIPGALTWKEYDQKNIKKHKLSNIPFGEKASKEVVKNFDQIFLRQNDSFYCSIDGNMYIDGEVLNLSNRSIVFIKYIRVTNKQRLVKIIDELKSNLRQRFDPYVENFELLIDDNYKDEIADLVMTIKPFLNFSSQKVVEITSKIFESIVDEIAPCFNEDKSMDYYIEYILDRHIVENLD